MAKRPFTVVRGGKLVDIARRKAAPTDILIKGDTIVEMGRPGVAAPADAAIVDARHRLMHPPASSTPSPTARATSPRRCTTAGRSNCC